MKQTLSWLLLILSVPILGATGCTLASDVGCTTDQQCREGRLCIDGSCQGPGGGVPNNSATNNQTPNNNSMPNNGSPNNNPVLNNGSPNNVSPNNSSPNNVTPPPNNSANNMAPDVALCDQVCDRLFGSCAAEQCNLSPDWQVRLMELYERCMFVGLEEGQPGCIDALTEEPGFRGELEEFLDQNRCDGDALQQFRCVELGLGEQCGCEGGGPGDSEIGSACMRNSDCDGGDFQGVCLDQNNQPPFPGGYCAATGCAVDPNQPVRYADECGPLNVCAQAGDGTTGVCVDGCFAHDECRAGYQCRLMGAVQMEPIRICLPQCGPNLRCRNNAERCNDGRCEFPCNADSAPGQPSSRDICEALGFECIADASGQSWCVMP